MQIDELIPHPDTDQRHSVLVAADPQRAWDSVRALDLGESWTIRALFAARGLPRAEVTWATLARLGFVPLVDDPPHELVLGLVARPWRRRGDIRAVTAEEFAAFDEPGYVKIAWSFAVTEAATGSRVTTVTLVAATDDEAHRRFHRYWRVVGPFSGVIRRRALALVARSAAAAPE